MDSVEEYLVVAVLPPDEVGQALRNLPALSVDPTRQASVFLRDVPSALADELSGTWGLAVKEMGSLKMLRYALLFAGLPPTAAEEYASEWEHGQAVVLLVGVPPERVNEVANWANRKPAGETAGGEHLPGVYPAGMGHRWPATPSSEAMPLPAGGPPPPPPSGADLPGLWTGGQGLSKAMPPPPPPPPSFRPTPTILPRIEPVPAFGPGLPEAAEKGILPPLLEGEPIFQPPAEQPPQIVRRYASVKAPGGVDADQTFDLTVALTSQAPADMLAQPMDVRVTAGTGQPPVTVIVYAPAFDVISASREIYADKETPPVSFQLRPKQGASGEQEVGATFLQGSDVLGRVTVKITVGGQAAVSTYVLPLDTNGPPAAAGTAAPDVVLIVERMPKDGGDHLHFQYLWPQNDEWDLAEGGTVDLNNVETWAQSQYKELSGRARFALPGPLTDPAVQAQVVKAARDLEMIGENLYDMLFPAEMKAFYRRFAAGPNPARTILIYSTEPWIPWEIVKPYGLDLDDPACEFLCARFEVARWLTGDSTRRVPRRVAVSQLCTVAPVPVPDLPAARLERDYMNALPQTWKPLALYNPSPVDLNGVVDAIGAGVVNLFHIATHGNFIATDPDKAALQIGGDQFTPSDLVGNKVLRGMAKSTPFFFLNACHSGRSGLALVGMGGWVDRVLRLGASGFIGGNWEVEDDLAATFAEEFYEQLRQGKTFGTACREARLKIRAANPGNSTWLAYVLYAHPLGRLTVGADAPAAAQPAPVVGEPQAALNEQPGPPTVILPGPMLATVPGPQASDMVTHTPLHKQAEPPRDPPPPPIDNRPPEPPTPPLPSTAPPEDLQAQRLKEWVAGILAVVLVLGTMALAGYSIIWRDGSEGSKNILLILSPLCGVVLGYYFGRIPADARAAQAQDTAKQAQKETADVRVKAEGVRQVAEKIVDKTRGLTRGGAGETAPRSTSGGGTAGDDLTDDLRELERLTRGL
ncbi:MAG: CHAT domain-containing protein [Chloroflexia bacterium]